MSGPVNVLAVLDDLHRGARLYCDSEGLKNRSNYADDLLERRYVEVRAAVAELIDTLTNLRKLTAPHDYKGYFTKASAIETLSLVHQRAEDALARVGGAA